MTWLLALNTLIEGLTGIAMAAKPALFYPTGDALTFTVARSFAVAAAALAVLSAAMLTTDRRSPAIGPGLVTLAFFHTCFAVTLVPAVRSGFSPLPVAIVHALLAVAFIAALAIHSRRLKA